MVDNNWHTLLILPKKSGYYKVKYFERGAGGMCTESFYYDTKTGWDVPTKYIISLWREESSEELKGDYECDECGYAEHNPIDRICPKCGGELCYMMTLQDLVAELTKENDQLRAENERLRSGLLEIANIFSNGGLRTVTMADRCVMIAQQALKEVKE